MEKKKKTQDGVHGHGQPVVGLKLANKSSCPMGCSAPGSALWLSPQGALTVFPAALPELIGDNEFHGRNRGKCEVHVIRENQLSEKAAREQKGQTKLS